MADRERKPLEPTAQPAPAGVSAESATAPVAWSPSRVLALQRTAGNRATRAMLARNGPDGGTGTVERPPGGLGDFMSLISEQRWEDAVRQLQGMPPAEMTTQLHQMRRVDLETLKDRAAAMGPDFTGVRDAAEAARVRQLGLDWDAAVAGGNWQEAVTLVQAYNDIDLPLKLDALTYDQIAALCRQADRMLPAFARTRRAAEPIRVRKLIAEYEAAVAAANWARAAELLAAFNDTDLATRVDALPVAGLEPMRTAAQAQFGSWGARVVHGLNRRMVSDEMQRMSNPAAPTRAHWNSSGNDPTYTDFSGWAMAPTQPPGRFTVTPGTVINCWEMVLYAAYRIGAIDWPWIHAAYMDATPDWYAGFARRLTPSGTRTYNKTTRQPAPRRGDIVLFNGVDHVALATGVQDAPGTPAARTHVWSFWVVPGGGTYGDPANVMDTTIEDLLPGCPPTCVVTFGNPPW
jgi:hypothetical protein